MHISNIITNWLFFVSGFFYILLTIMMKPLLYLAVLAFSFFTACNQQPGKIQTTADTLNTTPVVEKAKPDAAFQQQNEPAITSLPFGPKAGPKKLFKDESMYFYLDIIGEGYNTGYKFKRYKTLYPLPPIDKYIFTVVDSVYDPRYCTNEIPLDSAFRVNSYRVRLPDHEGFEVYYMADNTKLGDTTKPLLPGFNERCSNFELYFYGLLIYYQRATKTARVLPIYHNYYGESTHERRFYIDKDYRITLGNEFYSEGDYDSKKPVDVNNGGRYEIVMKKNGEFDIKRFGE